MEQQNEKTSTTEKQETVEVKSFTRKKRGRKPIDPDLPRETIIHDLSDDEKRCQNCTKDLPKIGEEITEVVKIIPKRVIVQKHVQMKYGPCDCEESKKNKTGKTIVCAGKPKKMIPGSITAASLLAYILTAKFVDHLPYYRQEKQFKRIGIEIARKSMRDWQIHVSRKCQKLFEIMEKEIRSGSLIDMDETTCQVLHEPGHPAQTKSFMWALVGGPTGKPIILYYYSPTRKSEIARNLLTDYREYLQTDGYKVYNLAIQ